MKRRFGHLEYATVPSRCALGLEQIRAAFSIPLEYEIELPGRDDVPFRPRGEGYVALPLDHLRLGLRFPLHKFVYHLLRKDLRCALYQLAPNALWSILCFIVRCAKFGIAPSRRLFWSLFQASCNSSRPIFCFTWRDKRFGERWTELDSSHRMWHFEWIWIQGGDLAWLPLFVGDIHIAMPDLDYNDTILSSIQTFTNIYKGNKWKPCLFRDNTFLCYYNLLREVIPTDMDIDSLTACFVGQSVRGSKAGGVVSKKRHNESGSSRGVKRVAKKRSNVVQTSSEDVDTHEDSVSLEQHVEVVSAPVGSSVAPKLRLCGHVETIGGSCVGSGSADSEIALGVKSIIRDPRPPILWMTEPEGDVGWSILDIRTRDSWTREGRKSWDTLKAFRIPADMRRYPSMEDTEFISAFRAHNAEAFSISCAVPDMLSKYKDRAEKAEELVEGSGSKIALLESDLQKAKGDHDGLLTSLEGEKAMLAAELATVRANHARELEDIELKKKEVVQSRDAEIARLMHMATDDYRKHVEIFLNTKGCTAFVTKKGSPAFRLRYTALEEFLGEGNVYTSEKHNFMKFVADRQAKKATTTDGALASGGTSSSREMVPFDGDGEYQIPLDDLLSYDRSFAGQGVNPVAEDDDAEGVSDEE